MGADQLQEAIPVLEAVLATFRKLNRPRDELCGALHPLAAAGYYAERRLAEQYGDEALELLGEETGLALAGRVRAVRRQLRRAPDRVRLRAHLAPVRPSRRAPRVERQHLGDGRAHGVAGGRVGHLPRSAEGGEARRALPALRVARPLARGRVQLFVRQAAGRRGRRSSPPRRSASSTPCSTDSIRAAWSDFQRLSSR